MSKVFDATEGYTPLTTQQEETVYLPDEKWSDSFALKVACNDFSSAEQYRTQNCDWRWRTANELYQAWVQQKYWEGSRVPRASIGVFVCFEQIESMLPKILSAIFAESPWFQADPIFGTTAEQARGWGAMIRQQMDDTRVREIYRRCIKAGLLYGNGIAKLSWKLQENSRLEWIPKMQPKAPGLNGGMPRFERVLDKKTVNEIENRPVLDYVSLTDFYIDPNCSSPQVADARYVVERKLVTVEDLALLRGEEGFKIPSDDVLIQMSRYKTNTQGDSTKGTEELFRLGNWYPAQDQTVDPGGKRIELLEYTTDNRMIWVLNRTHCAMNVPNPYGFKPYYDIFYADVLDRFYAMGVCDVVEGEQRLQASLLNGRLDELSLSLHRPMMKKIGVKLPTYALRSRPGQIWEINEKDDIQFMEIPNITQNAYIEANASELRVQKTTGLSDLYGSGTPSSGGNSASRTATGISAQVSASGARIQYLVENIENTFIEPMLNDVAAMNRMFPPVGTSMAETVALSRVRLSMRASARMQSKAALMQTLPLVLQTIANPALLAELAVGGETINWKELMTMVMDMTGYQNRADIVRKLTPQEMEQRKQPPPGELLRMQMQRERIKGQDAITTKKLEAQAGMAREKEDSLDEREANWTLAELAKMMLPLLQKESGESE